MSGGRQPLDYSNLKMVVFDEADEIFSQEANTAHLNKFYKKLHDIKCGAQSILFSATFDDFVQENINKFLPSCTGYKIEKEAMKLKGVK